MKGLPEVEGDNPGILPFPIYMRFGRKSNHNLFLSVGLEVLEAVRIEIEEGLGNIDRRHERLIPNIDEKRVESGAHCHRQKGSVD